MGKSKNYEIAYIGIDPGKHGSICIFYRNVYQKPVIFQSFDKQAYIKLFNGITEPNIITLEGVHSMPSDGKKSAFSFGENYGWIKGVIDVILHKNIDYNPEPTMWKKFYGLKRTKGMTKEEYKQLSIDLFLKLRPDLINDIVDGYYTKGKNKGKPKYNVDKAESYLLALYGYCKLNKSHKVLEEMQDGYSKCKK